MFTKINLPLFFVFPFVFLSLFSFCIFVTFFLLYFCHPLSFFETLKKPQLRFFKAPSIILKKKSMFEKNFGGFSSFWKNLLFNFFKLSAKMATDCLKVFSFKCTPSQKNWESWLMLGAWKSSGLLNTNQWIPSTIFGMMAAVWSKIC